MLEIQKDLESEVVEVLWVEIKVRKTNIMCTICRPPNTGWLVVEGRMIEAVVKKVKRLKNPTATCCPIQTDAQWRHVKKSVTCYQPNTNRNYFDLLLVSHPDKVKKVA